MRLLAKARRFSKIFETCISEQTKIYSNSSSPLSPRLPTLTLYTKEQCTLCNEAKQQLKPFAHRYHFEEVDIEKKENREWLKYRYDIPVFHFNGQFLMKHRANIPVLLRALEEFEKHGVE